MALHFTGSAAHRPLLLDGKASCDGEFGSSTQAIVIPDATISWSMKHYSDCTNRALWLSFVNPTPDFAFYVGSGIPVKVRQAPQTRTRTPSPSLFFRQLFLRPRQFQRFVFLHPHAPRLLPSGHLPPRLYRSVFQVCGSTQSFLGQVSRHLHPKSLHLFQQKFCLILLFRLTELEECSTYLQQTNLHATTLVRSFSPSASNLPAHPPPVLTETLQPST